MAATENQSQHRTGEKPDWRSCYLQKFRLYETRSKFYMIGRDKNRTTWRVLKIDRFDASELNIREDSTTYLEGECCDLLKRLHEGNRPTGGLKFVTTCYGIVGFVKFLGPYYMLLITKRRQIGAICGHKVYAVTKSELIPIPNSTVQSNMVNSKNENRSYIHSACNCVSMVLQMETIAISVPDLTMPCIIKENCVLMYFLFLISLLAIFETSDLKFE